MFRIASLKRNRRVRTMQTAIGLAAAAAVLSKDKAIWKKPRSQDWWTNIVLKTYTDEQWRNDFRMSKACFNNLCDRLREQLQRDPRVHAVLSVEQQVAITLYYLAGTSEYRTIGNLFGIAKSTVCECVKRVCSAIVDKLFTVFVKFPEGDELTGVIDGYKKFGFPNCGGAIDGTHIPIIAPSEHHADYVNRKGWYSVIMQGVCDHRYLFTDVYIGWPGRVHDARVLANSDIYRRGEAGTLIENRTVQVEANGPEIPVVLLGDPAYPMKQWLQKPFTDRANLTQEQSYFNYRLSRARMTIEDSFGRFKGRWRRFLKRIDIDVNFVPTLLAAGVVAHNICELNEEAFDERWLEGVRDAMPRQPVDVALHPGIQGTDIRNNLMGYFWQQRNNN